jgi:hypothetical protein
MSITISIAMGNMILVQCAISKAQGCRAVRLFSASPVSCIGGLPPIELGIIDDIIT